MGKCKSVMHIGGMLALIWVASSHDEKAIGAFLWFSRSVKLLYVHCCRFVAVDALAQSSGSAVVMD